MDRLSSRLSILGLAACAAPLLGAPRAAADLVHLANGAVLDGIVQEQTGSEVRVRVAWRGSVTLDRAEVARITPGDAAQHEELLAQWEAQYLRDQREQAQIRKEAAADAKRAAREQAMEYKRRSVAAERDLHRNVPVARFPLPRLQPPTRRPAVISRRSRSR
jgi:hypothetical protein